ncbi:MAG: phage tail tape measure protein [Acutalibacteraceae bacterium]
MRPSRPLLDFDSEMSRVKVIAGATDDEFEKLRKQAIQLNADTVFSASESAAGMENFCNSRI